MDNNRLLVILTICIFHFKLIFGIHFMIVNQYVVTCV